MVETANAANAVLVVVKAITTMVVAMVVIDVEAADTVVVCRCGRGLGGHECRGNNDINSKPQQEMNTDNKP